MIRAPVNARPAAAAAAAARCDVTAERRRRRRRRRRKKRRRRRALQPARLSVSQHAGEYPGQHSGIEINK